MRTAVPIGSVGVAVALPELGDVALAGFAVSFNSGVATLGVEGEGLACWAERLKLNKRRNDAARIHFFMIAPDYSEMTVKQG
jgi:hypothetical protein